MTTQRAAVPGERRAARPSSALYVESGRDWVLSLPSVVRCGRTTSSRSDDAPLISAGQRDLRSGREPSKGQRRERSNTHAALCGRLGDRAVALWCARLLSDASAVPSLKDLHLGHQTIDEAVDVGDGSVRDNRACFIAHDLVHSNSDAPIAFGTEARRADCRYDLAPLARPVVTHLVTSTEGSTLPAVRPHDVGCHGRQQRWHVAPVERRIKIGELTLPVRRSVRTHAPTVVEATAPL